MTYTKIKNTFGLTLTLLLGLIPAPARCMHETPHKLFSRLCSAINLGTSYYPALQGVLGLVGCGYTYLILQSSPRTLLHTFAPHHDVTEKYPRTTKIFQDMACQNSRIKQPKITITQLSPQGLAFLGITAILSSSCGIVGEIFIPEHIAKEIENKADSTPLSNFALELDHQKIIQEHGKKALAMLTIPLTSNYILKKITERLAPTIVSPKKVPALVLNVLKIPAGFGKLLVSLALLHYYDTWRNNAHKNVATTMTSDVAEENTGDLEIAKRTNDAGTEDMLQIIDMLD